MSGAAASRARCNSIPSLLHSINGCERARKESLGFPKEPRGISDEAGNQESNISQFGDGFQRLMIHGAELLHFLIIRLNYSDLMDSRTLQITGKAGT